MTQEQFDRYLEQTFDSFSKSLIRNEGKNAMEEIKTRTQHEQSLEMLSKDELEKITCSDSYTLETKAFQVGNTSVNIENAILSEMLQYLLPQRRDIILLSFFLDYNDTEIARELGISADTVSYRKRAALKRLRELLDKYEIDSC